MTNSAKRQHRANAPANVLSTDNAGYQVGPVELAARTGNVLETLRALRQKLATTFDTCTSRRDKAVVAKAFTDVLSLIEAEERRLGQQPRTADSNEDVRRTLSESAALGGGIRDELL